MNPKQFLVWGGLILVVLGLLGLVGLIGPTAEDSIFGSAWWFDGGENWAHLLLGVVALLASRVLGAGMQKWLVASVGVLGLVVAVYGFVVGENFLGANLENPADNNLHLVVGLWALWAARRGAPEAAMMPPQAQAM